MGLTFENRPQNDIDQLKCNYTGLFMKTAVQNSFLKFYVMIKTKIDVYGIVHVKVDFIPVPKLCVLPILGRFVGTVCPAHTA